MVKKVLIIDDSITIRRKVSFTLGKAGYEVFEANDGLEGLARLNQHPTIAVVISDINMPNMNGIEMLDKIKADGVHSKIPIMVLSTEDEPQLIAKAKLSGAKVWLVKPFIPEQLVTIVAKLAA